jgi:hypothetical protein
VPESAASRQHVAGTPTQQWLVSTKLFRKVRDDAARMWWQDGRRQTTITLALEALKRFSLDE